MDPEPNPIPPAIDPEDPAGSPSDDDRMWAFLAHLSYLLTYLIGVSCIAPLIIWLVKKEDAPFVEDQAKEALNFQLSVFLSMLVCSITCILIPVAIVILIGATVYSVIAAIEANRGNTYRYPYTFRLIQ